MSEENQNKPNQNKSDSFDAPLPISIREDVTDKPTSESQAQNTNALKSELGNIGTNIKSLESNWQIPIATIAVIVNIVLAIFTYGLFKEASNQTTNSRNSVSAAIRADSISELSFRELRFYDGESIKRQDSAFASNEKSTKAAFELQKTSIKETQYEFERINKPYIYFSELKSDSFKTSVNPRIYIKIKNFGKTPAYIYYIVTKIDEGPFDTYRTFYYEIDNIRKEKFVLASNEEDSIPLSNHKIAFGEFHEFISDNYVYFVHGEIVYSDLLKGKKEVYKFCYRVDFNGRFYENELHNGIEVFDEQSKLMKAIKNPSRRVPNSL